MSSNGDEENTPTFVEDEEAAAVEMEVVEENISDVEEEEETPEPVQPRRSNRQPKRKKRSSSESGNEELDDSKSKITCPLSHMREYIKIGNEYQANIDFVNPDSSTPKDEEINIDRDELIWSRPEDMERKGLENYVDECAGRFRMPIDRALYILARSNYNFEEALDQVASRKQLRDIWNEDETLVFSNAYMCYGKDFMRIRRSALPHRSFASIIQHYYDTKKHTPYKSSVDVKLSDPEESDDEEDEAIDGLFMGTCENCGERTSVLEYSKATERKECKTCLIYLRLNRMPRPSNIRTITAELRKTNVDCPKKMKPHLIRYKELTLSATGDPLNRLKIEKDEVKSEPVSEDEVMIIDECDLTKPAPPFSTENDANADPLDSNTCRMTRDFESQEAKEMITRLPYRTSLAIPCVWRQNQTVCMEDIEILNEESRKLLYETTTMFGRINKNEVNSWKNEMAQVRFRMDRKSEDSDLAPSATNKRKTTSYSWQDQERKDAIRCFYWYGDDFETIAEIIPTKTADQIKSFYADLGESVTKEIINHRENLRGRLTEETEALPPQLRAIVKPEEPKEKYDIIKTLQLS